MTMPLKRPCWTWAEPKIDAFLTCAADIPAILTESLTCEPRTRKLITVTTIQSWDTNN